MNEEDMIKARLSGRNPFTVPEGYFDELTSKVMARVDAEAAQPQQGLVQETADTPQRPTARLVPMMRRLRPLMAAACLLVAVLCVGIYLNNNTTESQLATTQETASGDADFDEAADYMLYDNYDIYACLSGE